MSQETSAAFSAKILKSPTESASLTTGFASKCVPVKRSATVSQRLVAQQMLLRRTGKEPTVEEIERELSIVAQHRHLKHSHHMCIYYTEDERKFLKFKL